MRHPQPLPAYNIMFVAMISLQHINLYERGDNQCHGVFILIVALGIQGDIATTMDAIDREADVITIGNYNSPHLTCYNNFNRAHHA